MIQDFNDCYAHYLSHGKVKKKRARSELTGLDPDDDNSIMIHWIEAQSLPRNTTNDSLSSILIEYGRNKPPRATNKYYLQGRMQQMDQLTKQEVTHLIDQIKQEFEVEDKDGQFKCLISDELLAWCLLSGKRPAVKDIRVNKEWFVRLELDHLYK